MQSLARVADTRRTNVKPQFVGHVTDLILPEPDGERSQAFLVEQTANWTLPTHFHQEHQFQVFVAGGGSLGKHPIAPLTVHYASPHSAYGPLVSGAEGISYLTLRAVSDTGAWYLPESRDKIKTHIPKRQVHGAPASVITPEALLTLAAPVQDTLIAPESSGLAAWLLRLPPHHVAPSPVSGQQGGEHGGGRFHVVTKGALCVDGDMLPALATAFVARGEMPAIKAGPAGVELIVLQYPEAALARS